MTVNENKQIFLYQEIQKLELKIESGVIYPNVNDFVSIYLLGTLKFKNMGLKVSEVRMYTEL